MSRLEGTAVVGRAPTPIVSKCWLGIAQPRSVNERIGVYVVDSVPARDGKKMDGRPDDVPGAVLEI